MKDFMLKLYTKAQMLREDHGQDLIEYTLIAALIAVGAVAVMKPLSTAINGLFTTVTAAVNAS